MPTKAELEEANEALKAENEDLKAREVATVVVEVEKVSGAEASARAAQSNLVESREYGEKVRRASKSSHLTRRAAQHESLG
jgi:hypothetical protein